VTRHDCEFDWDEWNRDAVVRDVCSHRYIIEAAVAVLESFSSVDTATKGPVFGVVVASVEPPLRHDMAPIRAMNGVSLRSIRQLPRE